MTQNILEVRNLVKHFETSNSFFTGKKNIIKAVDEVSFNIKYVKKEVQMTVSTTALSCTINCDTPVCPSARPNPENVEVAKNATSRVPKIPPTP